VLEGVLAFLKVLALLELQVVTEDVDHLVTAEERLRAELLEHEHPAQFGLVFLLLLLHQLLELLDLGVVVAGPGVVEFEFELLLDGEFDQFLDAFFAHQVVGRFDARHLGVLEHLAVKLAAQLEFLLVD